MADQWVILVLGLLCVMNLALCGVLAGRLRRLGRLLEQQQRRQEETATDVRALCAGAAGLSDRIQQIERRSMRISHRQEQLEQFGQRSRPYEQAVRLARKGSDVEELVTVCGLSKGEAELITMMQRLQEEGEAAPSPA